MITALLFDLDGTLLDSDMNVFMPHYFRALAAKLAPLVPADRLLDALLTSTRAMMRRSDHTMTNKDAFWADFLPRVGCSMTALEPLIDEFYRNDFPTLRRYTVTKPEARLVIEAAFARGFIVAIATQPVFPLVAIQQRLTWAGVADFPYALVTCYENMHTTKPDPAFYTEICEHIGRPAQACLMIGNEPEADIRPAAAAGLHTFWLTDQGQLEPPDLPADYTGTLDDVRRLIETWAREK